MTKYNVVFKNKEVDSTCKSTYTVAASSESEAISKWNQTIAGKSGRCQVVEVYKTGSRLKKLDCKGDNKLPYNQLVCYF